MGSNVGAPGSTASNSALTTGAAAVGSQSNASLTNAPQTGASASAANLTTPPAGAIAAPAQESKDSPGGAKRTSSGISDPRKPSRSSSTKKDPYHSPWEKYKRELHTLTGELNFREFVEALVRIAAFTFSDPVYGTLARKLEVLVEEHLQPFTCQSSSSAPLFSTSRSHKSTLTPFMPFLLKVFLYCTQLSSFGPAQISTLPTTNPSPTLRSGSSIKPQQATQPAEVQNSLPTCTIRQLAVLLKEAGAFEGKFTMAEFLKLVPFDQHPSLTAAVFRHRHMTTQPNPTSAQSGQQQAGNPTQVLASPNLAGTSASISPSHSERGSVLSTEHENLVFAEGEEALFRRKIDAAVRSRGYQCRNTHSTLAMELELTFGEFIERLIQVGLTVYPNSMPTASRINAFFSEKLRPLALKVGYLKPFPTTATSTAAASNPTPAAAASSK